MDKVSLKDVSTLSLDALRRVHRKVGMEEGVMRTIEFFHNQQYGESRSLYLTAKEMAPKILTENEDWIEFLFNYFPEEFGEEIREKGAAL